MEWNGNGNPNTVSLGGRRVSQRPNISDVPVIPSLNVHDSKDYACEKNDNENSVRFLTDGVDARIEPTSLRKSSKCEQVSDEKNAQDK